MSPHLSRCTGPLLVLLLLAGCGDGSPDQRPQIDESESIGRASRVVTGAQHLVNSNFAVLAGKRVGLIANQTTRVDSVHLVDLMAAAPTVELAALFGPEHGVRGMGEAGEKLADGTDEETGLPVFSLYGEHRAPTERMLDGIDVIVFDVQDIGSRFYTYISTMGLAMQAAARFGAEFVVLDRPNPLGGEMVEGFLRKENLTSFVGLYPIPVTHAMTVGELARMIQGEGMLPDLDDLPLTVIEMTGWRRDMQWPDTGLPWFQTSPNIPNFETAVAYPGTCLFEGTVASEGRGTLHPFLTVGADFVDEVRMASNLNAAALPGVEFRGIRFTPRSIEGMSTSPKLLDRDIGGVRISVTDSRIYEPVRTGVQIVASMLQEFTESAGSSNGFFIRSSFDERSGSPLLADELLAGLPAADIAASWEDDVRLFRQQRAPYLLYD
jgi:uncharacterized protein YbbC (DUF1343 family)